MAVYTVVKTVGSSSRQYSTLQAWEDGSPVDLTTAEKSAAGTFLVAAFQIGESLTFSGSGATGKLLETDSTGAGNGTYIVYGITAGNPIIADVVTGGTSGATCVLSSSTADNVGVIWQGQCYNDSEFVLASTPVLSIAGSTASSTTYKELTTASGQSFQDNANVRTNRLDYVAANGVAVRCNNVSYGVVISPEEAYLRISKIQLFTTHSSSYPAIYSTSDRAGRILKDLISKANGPFAPTWGNFSKCINVVSILVDVGGTGLYGAFRSFVSGVSVEYIACTGIRVSNSTAGGTGFTAAYADQYTMVSCAAFGFTSPQNNCNATGSKNNATDNASGLVGTSNQHSVTYTNATPFTEASSTNTDLRAIAATSLINNGFLDSTNAPNDISVTARDSTPTIGAWEVTAVGVNVDQWFNWRQMTLHPKEVVAYCV